MTTVWLIRHGHTASNGRSYAGRADVPLDATGIAQARSIATQLSRERLDLVLSSPLRRALDTARPLADSMNCPIHMSSDLLEFDFGDLEGCAKGEVALSLRKAHLTTPVPGGESLADLWARTGRIAQQVSGLPPHARVAIVGHYWTNRMIHGHLIGCTMEQTAQARSYRPQTGSIHRLTIEASGSQGRSARCHAGRQG